MLNLFGSTRRLCDGVTRREFLRLGGLGAFGFGLSDSLAIGDPGPVTSGPAAHFGKAKACILIFLYGSPPQHETFDPKPDAIAEVRGEIGSIPSAVPGLRVGELLPRTARMMDQLTVVRSMTHRYPEHGVAYAVSGIPTYTPELETRPRDSRHWPYIGSVVEYFEEQRSRSRRRDGSGPPPAMPANIGLPWMLNSKTDMLVNAGPFAAFLGQAYDPLWADFTGPGTRHVPKYTDGQRQEFLDPFGGTLPSGRFQLSTEGRLRDDIPIERLNLRQSLLGQFELSRRQIDRSAHLVHRHRQRAYSLLTSNAVHQALDIAQEPMALRERYGMTVFGQACLAARRLVEAGTKFITVLWDGYGQFSGCAWDTHANHYPRLKEYLLPGFDLAYPALIEDLRQRGMLDDTLVLCLSEHGRTPQIDSRPRGAGRHHWSRVYSTVLAGGGMGRGNVVGSSDRMGGEVNSTPISPKDILATSFHLLGIDPHTLVSDAQGRPFPIAGEGEVRRELLA